MAFEHLEANELVHRVSLERAATAGQGAGAVAMGALLPYSGEVNIFSSAQVQNYARVKGEEAAATYLAERIAGLHNDLQSLKPGVTALIREVAKARIEHIWEGRNEWAPVSWTPVEDTKGADPLFILRLPEGRYMATRNRVEFCDLAELNGVGRVVPHPTDATSTMVADYEVVTIIGDGGEYWQSPHFNIDGTIREVS